jgi:hypothetical protein
VSNELANLALEQVALLQQVVNALRSRVKALEKDRPAGPDAVAPVLFRDWPEDFDWENGRYVNTCCECKQEFMGLKGRDVCKKCVSDKVAKMKAKTAPAPAPKKVVQATLRPGVFLREDDGHDIQVNTSKGLLIIELSKDDEIQDITLASKEGAVHYSQVKAAPDPAAVNPLIGKFVYIEGVGTYSNHYGRVIAHDNLNDMYQILIRVGYCDTCTVWIDRRRLKAEGICHYVNIPADGTWPPKEDQAGAGKETLDEKINRGLANGDLT